MWCGVFLHTSNEHSHIICSLNAWVKSVKYFPSKLEIITKNLIKPKILIRRGGLESMSVVHKCVDVDMINRILCVLDRASSWYLNKGRPTRWHLLYYVNLLLNMFQILIHPSSGACDYLVRYCVGWLEAYWCCVHTLGYHITNRQSRYITSTRLKSAYTTTQQVVKSSWRWMY